MRATRSLLVALGITLAAPLATATGAAGDTPSYIGVPALRAALASRNPNATIAIPQPSAQSGAIVGEVLMPTGIRSGPGRGRTLGTLATTTISDQPEVVVVLAAQIDRKGTPWVKVELPTRPDGSSGWVDGDALLTERDPWYISVTVQGRTVDVYLRGHRLIHTRAVVGGAGTPTPTGEYSVYAIVAQAPPNGFLGPYTVQLNAYSKVLHHFGAGTGRVAIHGRGGASFQDPLGSARSHGCIRINNNFIEQIAADVPLGTPVSIS